MTRAIVFNGDETWEERELPVPDPQPGGAVLRVEATGLCHSDVDQFKGIVHSPMGGAFPAVPGHEVIGRIEKIDAAAAKEWGVSEGDRVAVRTIAITPDGQIIAYGHDLPIDHGSGLYGGYAEHMEIIPGSAVFPIREDLPAAELTIFEPLSCTCTWVAPVNEGDTVVIEGPGHMGLCTVVAARASGAGTIIVTGLSQDLARMDTALRIGADFAIDVQEEEVVARVAELTDGRMAEVVIDAAAGNPITVNTAMDLVATGGRVVLAGFKERPVDGFMSNRIPERLITIHPGAGLDPERAVNLINEGAVPTNELLGDTFPLDQFEEAFALLDRRLPGRDSVRVALEIS